MAYTRFVLINFPTIHHFNPPFFHHSSFIIHHSSFIIAHRACPELVEWVPIPSLSNILHSKTESKRNSKLFFSRGRRFRPGSSLLLPLLWQEEGAGGWSGIRSSELAVPPHDHPPTPSYSASLHRRGSFVNVLFTPPPLPRGGGWG